jgi:arabinofuranan 3-O-arabinosyltransferase
LVHEAGDAESSTYRVTPSGAAAAGLYLLFVAMSLIQQPGATTYDTRGELTERPLSFLDGSFTLWHPDSNFGEVQNQAYGYLFPQGTWFVLMDWLQVPDWVSQRLWSALILIIACEGARRVARAVGLPGPPALVAGIAFGFAPRMLGTLPVITAESLPGAVMPWVVLPVLLALNGRLASRTAAVLSGAAVVCMGGVNAVENAGSLPLAAILVVWGVRRGLVHRWFVLEWGVAVVVASLWWALPLLVLAGYAPPFYEYVESAVDTTALIGWSQAVRGDSHWVFFLITGDQAWWPAGHALVSDPVLICVSAVIAAIGLLGLARLDNGLRRPLMLSVLIGLAALTIAHGGPAGSPLAELVRGWLDGPLQIFRNVHKIDPIVRLPLAIGFGSAVATGVSWAIERRPSLSTSSPLAVLAALMLVLTLGQPYVVNNARTPGWDEISESWQDAQTWLREHDDGTTTLIVPGSGFAQQNWGWTIDEPLQLLGGADRVTRSQVPLIPGESIRFLAALDQQISTGRATPRLADQLARAGIGHVVIRRDLLRGLTRSPHPGFAAVSLSQAGLRSVARFGEQGEGGPEVEILEVFQRMPMLRSTSTDDVATVRGAPESILRAMSSGLVDPRQATVLEGEPDWRRPADVVTDGNQRRERAFGSNDEALSALMTATEPWRTERAVHDFPTVPDKPRVVARYDGLEELTASSSQGYADNFGPVTPQAGPYSAVDRDPNTRWVSSQATDPAEQWVRMDFDGQRPVRTVSVLPVMDDREVAPIRELEVWAGDQSVRLLTNASGAPVLAEFDGREVGSVEVRVMRAGTRLNQARVGIRDIEVDGLVPDRTFLVPGTVGARSSWVFGTDPDRRACVISLGQPDCSVARIRAGEERTGMDRTFTLAAGQRVRFRGRVVARGTFEAARLLEPLGDEQQVGATSFYGSDPKVASRFAYDGETSTAWVSSDNDPSPTMLFRWSEQQVIRGLGIQGGSDEAPVGAIVRSGGRTERVGFTGSSTGEPRRPFRTRQLEVTFLEAPDAEHVVVPELELRGVEIVRPFEAGTPTGAKCGFGPLLQIDGQQVDTRVHGTMADVVNGTPLRLVGCGPASVTLDEGQHRLRTPSNAEFQVIQVAGVPMDSRRGDLSRARLAKIVRWGETQREAEVTAGGETLLSLPENFNPGWVATVDGTELRALRVDGWQQAWLLPASEERERVEFEYRPQRAYAAVLNVGLGSSGVLLLAGCVGILLLLVRRRARLRTPRPWPGAPSPISRGALGVVVVAAMILLGPVVGVALLVGAVLPSSFLGRALGSAAGLIAGSAVLEVAVSASWADGAAEALTAFAVGVIAGVGIGGRG